MTVPLVVTMDVEIASDHDLGVQAEVLDRLRRDFAALGIPVTAFSTATAAEEFAPELRALAADGHEVACHGLSHAPGEDFARMPAAAIRATLAVATRRITRASGRTPRCFRGPRMTSSATAQQILVEMGYIADFSVCSQRFDLLNCRGAEFGWLLAPRRPYFPAPTSPFRRGNVPIRVVPLSCLGVPFLSGLLYTAGLHATEWLFRALLAESRRTGKPVVYLFHPYEFAPRSPGRAAAKLLHRTYRTNRERRYRDTVDLLRAMLSQPGIQPMTGSEYVHSIAGPA